MLFSEFSKYLDELENTPSRLEITRILSQLLSKLESTEIEGAVFLSLGTVGPRFEKVEFGVSGKLMMRIISRAFSTPLPEVLKLFKQSGDLGATAQNLRSKNSGLRIKHLTVQEVIEALKKAVETTGAGSVEGKINLMTRLLKDLDPLSVRFVVRIPLGTMRLGFSEKTVLEALAALSAGDEISFARGSKSREIKEALERKYNVYPNIGLIAAKFTEKGLAGLKAIRVKVGAPVEPQLCARLETAAQMIERVGGAGGEVVAEYKYDGMRLQMHLNRKEKIRNSKFEIRNLPLEEFTKAGVREDPRVKMFTRNFEQMQHVFPDLTEALLKAVRAEEAIIDGEAVGVAPKSGRFIPFQETIQRKRKYNVEEMVKKIPVKYFAFDILYKDGQDLTDLPYLERRKILSSAVSQNDRVVVSQSFLTSDPTRLQNYFKEAKDKGLEGLIVKNPQSSYEAGNRGFSWVKFKREEDGTLTDTIDCVVLGYNAGTGKRSGFGIGAFLVGIFDDENDKFLTIAKIGTGLTDEEWRALQVQSAKIKVQKIPKNVEIKKELMPDVPVRPETVVQIRADEITVSPIHSSGYALRFPRMMGYRPDKKPEQATTLSEIEEMHRLQGKK